MFQICNAIISFFYYIIFYIINIYIWCKYASIQSLQVYKQTNKLHITLKNIYTYYHSLQLGSIIICYYYNYKSIIHIKNNHIDFRLLHTQTTSNNTQTEDLNRTIVKEDDKEDSDISIQNDIDKDIDNIKNTFQLLKYNTKCIITNTTIQITNVLSVHVNNIIIQPNKEDYSIYIRTLTINYNTIEIGCIHKITITYYSSKKNIIIDIHTLNIKLLQYEVNIKDCIDTILKHITLDGEKTNYTIKLFIHKIYFNFYHKNSLQLYVKNINYNTSNFILYSDNIILKSCKKNILTIQNCIYDVTDQSVISIDTIRVELYKTTLYKLKLSIDFLIQKKQVKNTKQTSTLQSSVLQNTNNHLESLINYDYVNNIDYSDIDIHTNKLTNISTNKLTNISTIIHKLNININHLYIKVLLKQKHYFIYFHSLSYTKYSKIMYNIQIKKIKIMDQDNKIYTHNKFNANNKIDITFKDHFLNVFIFPLLIELNFDIIKDITNVLEENMIDLKKLLYYDYIKYNYKEYFIHHLVIHTVLIDISYYPKKSPLYKNIFSKNKKYSIYNITNYKHIQLSTKEIDIYYPLSTNNLFKKITKIWLQDIYKHQIKNIMRGIKYTKPLPITYDFSSKMIKHIKTLLKSSVQYLDNE